MVRVDAVTGGVGGAEVKQSFIQRFHRQRLAPQKLVEKTAFGWPASRSLSGERKVRLRGCDHVPAPADSLREK